jgi:hypothetical protein
MSMGNAKTQTYLFYEGIICVQFIYLKSDRNHGNTSLFVIVI